MAPKLSRKLMQVVIRMGSGTWNSGARGNPLGFNRSPPSRGRGKPSSPDLKKVSAPSLCIVSMQVEMVLKGTCLVRL